MECLEPIAKGLEPQQVDKKKIGFLSPYLLGFASLYLSTN